jgi:predicted dehydrogenase
MVHRIGIVGAGFLTRHSLVPAVHAMPGGRLVAVLDPSREALELAGSLAPDALLTSDEDAFFDTPMDAVHVATPNHLHEHYAVRALKQGVATIVEKPLAHTVESGHRILAAAAASDAPAIVGYMSKHNVFNREARRLVTAGAIGMPLAMVAARCGWRKDDWRSQRSTSGFGCLGDLGIYPVLTAVDLFGADPVRCQASMWPVRDPARTDLYAQATLWFDESRYLHFETAATFDEQPASAEVSSYTVVGDAGIIQVRGAWQMEGTGELVMCDGDGWHPAPGIIPIDPYLSQYLLLAACGAGTPVPPEVSIERGVRDLQILNAIRDSAAAGGVGPVILDRKAPQPC